MLDIVAGLIKQAFLPSLPLYLVTEFIFLVGKSILSMTLSLSMSPRCRLSQSEKISLVSSGFIQEWARDSGSTSPILFLMNLSLEVNDTRWGDVSL